MPYVFAFVRFSAITAIHFEPALVPSVVLLFCSTTSVVYYYRVEVPRCRPLASH